MVEHIFYFSSFYVHCWNSVFSNKIKTLQVHKIRSNFQQYIHVFGIMNNFLIEPVANAVGSINLNGFNFSTD